MHAYAFRMIVSFYIFLGFAPQSFDPFYLADNRNRKRTVSKKVHMKLCLIIRGILMLLHMYCEGIHVAKR